jgi:site-specific DNA-cytosine methylase
MGLVLVGSGPPCQGVSGLNSDGKGGLKHLRSKLFKHVPRIVELCKKTPWAQVHSLTENVASMDKGDCEAMSAEFASQPWFVDACGISLAHRPRLFLGELGTSGS